MSWWRGKEVARAIGEAMDSFLAAHGFERPVPTNPVEAWRFAAEAWRQRCGFLEARAEQAEKERDELRERVKRLDQALDRMAGPAR